jgi:hypothetical protein
MSLTSTISYRSYQPIGNHEYPVLRKNGTRSTPQMPTGGFRRRVTGVQIFPGPLSHIGFRST